MSEDPAFPDDVVTCETRERARRAFTIEELPRVERVEDLRPFAQINAAQVIGLLAALGEYSARAPRRAATWTDVLPDVWTHPDAAARHDSLCRFWRARHWPWLPNRDRDDEPPDAVTPLPDPARRIFLASTSASLAIHKYIKGLEQLTVGELCRLLGRLGRYAAVARPMPDAERALREGSARMLNGHNRLIEFPARPFTYEAFRETVWATVAATERRRHAVGIGTAPPRDE